MSLRRPPLEPRDRPGASAAARYAELRAAGRTRRLALVAATALVLALAGWLLLGWRAAAVGALWGAAAMLLVQWRRDGDRTWARGAAGERKTARLLRPLERAGYLVLHDRAIPGSRANLDHLVITPSGGVIVVDSKQWARRQLVKSGGRAGWVRVGRVRGDKVVRSSIWEAKRVGQELTRAVGYPVPVRAVLAVHGGRLPAWRRLVVDGVPLLRARQVRAWITDQEGAADPARHRLVSDAARSIFTAYIPTPGTERP